MARFTSNQKVLDSVVTTTTSGAQDTSMRIKYSLQFIATGITSGNGVFTVDVTNSDDGAGNANNWVPYSRLITNAAKTNAQTDTGVASVTLSSTGSQFVFFPVGDHFRYIRVTCTRTIDGTYSAILQSVD